MTNPDYFMMLKSLVEEHENSALTSTEYRAKRKMILAHLDQHYNSIPLTESEVIVGDATLLGRVGEFFKGLRHH